METDGWISKYMSSRGMYVFTSIIMIFIQLHMETMNREDRFQDWIGFEKTEKNLHSYEYVPIYKNTF